MHVRGPLKYAYVRATRHNWFDQTCTYTVRHLAIWDGALLLVKCSKASYACLPARCTVQEYVEGIYVYIHMHVTTIWIEGPTAKKWSSFGAKSSLFFPAQSPSAQI
jgi:hypothetical protein